MILVIGIKLLWNVANFFNQSYIFTAKYLKIILLSSLMYIHYKKSISIIGYLLYKIIQNTFPLRFKQDQPYNFYKH